MKNLSKGGFLETIKTVCYAVLIAVIIRTFGYEPFNIPSGSMIPTLLIGDYLFVSKFSYGYSKHSFPLSPQIFSGRFFASPIKRGDVAVFKLPSNNKTAYIKRIIGLPGDSIQIKGGRLFLNKRMVTRQRIEPFTNISQNGRLEVAPQFLETLPNGRAYKILEKNEDTGPLDNTPIYIVPKSHYFALGDNRDNSLDSRVPNRATIGGVGFIPFENLVGRAEVLFFSTDGTAGLFEFWGWFKAMRFSRFFQPIV